LSREIVAFGVFAGLATLYAAAVLADQYFEPAGNAASSYAAQWIDALSWSVAVSGAFAVFCSVMIYVFTQRECWSPLRVGVRFVLTAALLGIAATWLSILVMAVTSGSEWSADLVRDFGPPLCRALIAVSLIKLIWEALIFRHLMFRRNTPLRRSALLLSRELSSLTLVRFALGLLGGVLMPAMLLGQFASVSGGVGQLQFVLTAGLLFLACLAGELVERYLFFAACAAPRMPGGIR
jgi:DMSO reductase anchor subunit